MSTTTPTPTFRDCEVTGFRIDLAAQRHTLANAIAAVGLLALGGTFAILIALQRQGIPISDEWWYRLLASHGATMLLFWIIFFEVAALYFGSTVLLNARMLVPRLAWANFAAMIIGVTVAEWAMLSGRATVMFTAYPPLTAHWSYYAGVLLFAVGALVACVIFFANIVVARREQTYTGSLPLVVYGLVAAAVIAVYSLATGAVAYGMLFLQSIGVMESVDPATYRLFFWGIGHGAQQINLAAMVAVWYALIGLTVGGRPVNEGLSRFAFLLYVAFIHLGAVHHLLVDPGLGTSHRIMNTSYFLYLAVLASLIHAFSIPAAIEVAQRERGFGRGWFTWLRRAPWKEPGFSSLVLSVVYFGFIAGVTGVLMGTMQLNMIIHNTLFVVGHFHATVVSGTTLAFMGISYYLVPLLSRRRLHSVRMARWQPYVFGGGLAILTLGMLFAGQRGVPRRVADLEYSAAPIGVDLFGAEGMIPSVMALVSVGAVIAVTGGIMYVWNMVATLLWGERTARGDEGLDIVFAAQLAASRGRGATGSIVPDPSLSHAEQRAGLPRRWARFEAPGTYVIVLLFLAWFVVMYAAAHLNLSRAWPIG
ncbi:MAG: cbb3-type cytochrome c oxidase subunit I [Nitriliruptoraceae bacterium]